MVDAAAVFWSYAHDDDRLDRGRVIELAEHLRDELALTTGREMRFFVDRSGIEWGDEWRGRIDTALVETTFFIPVLTPKYFTRPECRRELLEFHAQAESLGLRELILPIRYLPVADLNTENPDEAVALAARMQYEDWTSRRLLNVDSAEYRQAVNKLAVRLVNLAQHIETLQVEKETASSLKQADDAGLLEHLQRLDDLLPPWVEAVERDMVNSAQYMAVDAVYVQRFQKLATRGAPPSHRLAMVHREATDSLPLALNYLEARRTYSSRTIELQPEVAAVFRFVEPGSPDVELLRPLYEAVLTATEGIRQGDERLAVEGRMPSEDYWHQHRRVSRTASRLEGIFREGRTLAEEANAMVAEWARTLRVYFPPSGYGGNAASDPSPQSSKVGRPDGPSLEVAT